MIQIKGLKKTYPSGVQALRGINLEIPAGMFGLLGPNGAGKSTFMKILATLLEPDEGSLARMGEVDLIKDKNATRKFLGYLPQDFGLYPTFTAEQMLDYLAKLKGIVDAKKRKAHTDALLEQVNLDSARHQKLGTYSGGMRQRFGIAQALLGQPRLLIVDEPTAGLDPEERNRFHNMLAEIADDVVVILSTHIVSDVSNLCGRMAIIRRGEIISDGTPSDAIKQMNERIWEASVDKETSIKLQPLLNIISSQMFEGRVRLRVFSENVPPTEEFKIATPTLEDYYFILINKNQNA